jgi:hypothetical protein
LAEVEVERIDPFQQDVGQNLSDTFFSESKIVSSDDGRVDEEKSDCVRTVFADNFHGVGVILEFLTHLLSVPRYQQKRESGTEMHSRSEDETGDDQVLPWSSVEKMCTEDEQSVEPTSGLIDTLGDEIGRVGLVESINVLERIMRLGIWHTT